MKNLFSSLLSRKKSRKPQIIIIGFIAFIAIFGVFLINAYHEAGRKQKPSNPFLVQQAAQQKDLDYNIVKVDTIAFQPLTPQQQPVQQRRQNPAPQQPVTKKSTPAPRQATPRSAQSQNQDFRVSTWQAPTQVAPNSGGDMIVVNRLGGAQNPGAGGASNTLGAVSGLQSVRLKVILPQKTPVVSGSLLEARVIKAGKIGDFEIPRRAQLIGATTLFNNRVNVEFREIRINGKTYSCSGRAFDLKLFPGLRYNSLNSRAKQVLLDELKSSAFNVPVVGRLVNQPDFNPLNDEIARLDEGLEFYAVITNIF